MPFYLFIWNAEIEQYLDHHGVTPDEFEEVVSHPDYVTISRSSGRWLAFGETSSKRYLACAYELVDGTTVLPITAFEPDKE